MVSPARELPHRIHLIGIGGSGMSALAHVLVDMGHEVSGSDIRPSDDTSRLVARGATIYVGHAAKQVAAAALVVVSDAIPPANIELAEAHIRAIPIVRRAECLDLICRARTSIMVSGAHGKSTTTAMIAAVLAQAGADPGFFIGADVDALGGLRARAGDGAHFVAEACEAFQNLAAYRPDIAIITNIDDEHIEHYGTQEKIDAAFLDYANHATTAVIANGDDAGIQRLLGQVIGPVTTFGFSAANDVSPLALETTAAGSTFRVLIDGIASESVVLPVPGMHMVANALACIACSRALGVSFNDIAAGLRRFTGVRRRWQAHDAAGHIRLIDDHAHHPRELAALAETARLAAGGSRAPTIAFQPQLYSRTKRLETEFADELAKFSQVFLLDIDGAGEPNPDGYGISALATGIRRRGTLVHMFQSVNDLVHRAPQLLSRDDWLITAGAGSIRDAAPRLAQHYREHHASAADHAGAAVARSSIAAAGPASATSMQNIAADDADDTVLSLLHRQFERQPDHTAVCGDGDALSYAGLRDAAEDLAAVLRSDHDINPGDVVGVCLGSSIALIVAIVALATVGAVYLPMDSSLPVRRRHFMLRTASAKLVIAEQPRASDSDAEEFALFDAARILNPPERQDRGSERAAVAKVSGADLAYICFTSGSTGEPKGVAIRHSSLDNLVRGIRGMFGIDQRTRMLLNTSISFDVSIGEIWMTLCGGGTLHATGRDRPLVGDWLGDFIAANAITHIAVTPSVLATVRPADLPALRCIISAGEACPQALVDTWAPGRTFFNAYGPTEATVYATVARCRTGKPVTIGRPLPNVSAYILDEAQKPVAAGQTGELHLGGPGLAVGYIGQDGETRRRFFTWSATPASSERLYRTGDIAMFAADGAIVYGGRSDDQVKIHGNRIELEEIEHAVRRHPSVLDAAACVHDSGDSKELVCFVVLRAQDEFDWVTMRQELSNWLPPSMIPGACTPVREIALTPSGKKDRRRMLHDYAGKRLQHAAYTAPENDIERKLVAIWKTVLGADADIGTYEDFAWLGGDSLKALQLVMEVEQAFKVRVPPGYFGRFATIHRMALRLAELLDAQTREPELTGFRASRVYKNLRDITAGWSGSRARPDSIIVSAGPADATRDLFLCLQGEAELHSIAEHLGPAYRVHGMRSGHLVMDYTPDATLALCEHYIDEIAAIRPTGMLMVGGICQGGLIAATMANLMRAKGYDIALLVLIEQSRLIPYDGEVAFFYCEAGPINPYRRFSSGLARYDDIYGTRHSVDVIPGFHGESHLIPSVSALAFRLERRLQRIGRVRPEEQRVDQRIQVAGGEGARFRRPAQARPVASDRHDRHGQSMAEWVKAARRSLYRRAGQWAARLSAGREDALLIHNSHLFDADYYVGQSRNSAGRTIWPAQHYALHGWRQGLDPGPIFKTSSYLERYPDVAAANINPLVHYLRSGMREGRALYSERDMTAWSREMDDSASQPFYQPSRQHRLRTGDLVLIHAHSRGHIVFQQFQQLLVQAFQSIGIDCVAADENTRPDGKPPTLRIVIAPHDFYFLAGGPSSEAEAFKDSVPVNSEQIPSVWLARSLPFLLRAPLVLDLNFQTAGILTRMGARATFLPLGFVPENDIFTPQIDLPAESSLMGMPPDVMKAPASITAPLETRGIDILFIGSDSERRQRFLSVCSDLMASKTCYVRMVNIIGALERSHPQSVSARAHAALSQRSKILLNAHHFDTPYFEWQRLMHFGLMQACCVVTERTTRVPGLIPGEHYFEDEFNKLPALAAWLLNDPDGRARAEAVRLAGYRAAMDQFQLGRTLRELFAIA